MNRVSAAVAPPSKSTASKYSSTSAYLYWLDHGLPVHRWVQSIPVSNCISKLARSRPQCAYLGSLNLGHQLHLQTCSITASECISEFTQSRPPSVSFNSHNDILQVHRYWARGGVQRYRGNGGGLSVGEYIFRRPRGRYTSTHFHLIVSYNENTHSILPNFWSLSLFPRWRGSTPLRGFSRPGSMISSHFLPRLLDLEPIQMLLRLCSTTISGQIDRTYTYRDT